MSDKICRSYSNEQISKLTFFSYFLALNKNRFVMVNYFAHRMFSDINLLYFFSVRKVFGRMNIVYFLSDVLQ